MASGLLRGFGYFTLVNRYWLPISFIKSLKVSLKMCRLAYSN